jgi:hypothetical protein
LTPDTDVVINVVTEGKYRNDNEEENAHENSGALTRLSTQVIDFVFVGSPPI